MYNHKWETLCQDQLWKVKWKNILSCYIRRKCKKIIAISTAVEAFNNVYENIPAPVKAVFIVAATTVAIALEDLMPHVHDKTVPGKVRAPYPDEIPGH